MPQATIITPTATHRPPITRRWRVLDAHAYCDTCGHHVLDHENNCSNCALDLENEQARAELPRISAWLEDWTRAEHQ